MYNSPVVGSGKENLILTMHRPFGQSQSRIIAVSGNVDQSKPVSHFNSQIDPYILCILIECVCSKMQHKCWLSIYVSVTKATARAVRGS